MADEADGCMRHIEMYRLSIAPLFWGQVSLRMHWLQSICGVYLRICKQRAQSRPQVGPQGQCVDDEVLMTCGHLHEAGEALEAAKAVVLQVHGQLISPGQTACCLLQGRQGVDIRQ